MIAAVLEKYSFGAAALVLYLQARIDVPVLVFASLDLLLGTLFVAAYVLTKPPLPSEDAHR